VETVNRVAERTAMDVKRELFPMSLPRALGTAISLYVKDLSSAMALGTLSMNWWGGAYWQA
jgi:hypothetical protein